MALLTATIINFHMCSSYSQTSQPEQGVHQSLQAQLNTSEGAVKLCAEYPYVYKSQITLHEMLKRVF